MRYIRGDPMYPAWLAGCRFWCGVFFFWILAVLCVVCTSGMQVGILRCSVIQYYQCGLSYQARGWCAFAGVEVGQDGRFIKCTGKPRATAFAVAFQLEFKTFQTVQFLAFQVAFIVVFLFGCKQAAGVRALVLGCFTRRHCFFMKRGRGQVGTYIFIFLAGF